MTTVETEDRIKGLRALLQARQSEREAAEKELAKAEQAWHDAVRNGGDTRSLAGEKAALTIALDDARRAEETVSGWLADAERQKALAEEKDQFSRDLQRFSAELDQWIKRDSTAELIDRLCDELHDRVVATLDEIEQIRAEQGRLTARRNGLVVTARKLGEPTDIPDVPVKDESPNVSAALVLDVPKRDAWRATRHPASYSEFPAAIGAQVASRMRIGR